MAACVSPKALSSGSTSARQATAADNLKTLLPNNLGVIVILYLTPTRSTRSTRNKTQQNTTTLNTMTFTLHFGKRRRIIVERTETGKEKPSPWAVLEPRFKKTNRGTLLAIFELPRGDTTYSFELRGTKQLLVTVRRRIDQDTLKEIEEEMDVRFEAHELLPKEGTFVVDCPSEVTAIERRKQAGNCMWLVLTLKETP